MIQNKTGKSQTYGINEGGFLKRMMSIIIDTIMLIVVMSGLMALFSWSFGYDKAYSELEQKYIEYGVFVQDSETQEYYACEMTYDEATGEVIETDSCYLSRKAFYSNQECVALSNKCDNLMILILSLAGLISLLILEFAVPLLIKNGRTIGGWVMHVGLISKEGIKISVPQLFARCVIGRFAIETMVPVLLIAYAMINLTGGLFGVVGLVILLSAELACMSFTKHHQSVHDAIANVVCVDMDSQYFADSLEELNRLKEESKENMSNY